MARPYSMTVVVGEGDNAKHRQIGAVWKNERGGRYEFSGYIYFGNQRIYIFPPDEDKGSGGGYKRGEGPRREDIDADPVSEYERGGRGDGEDVPW